MPHTLLVTHSCTHTFTHSSKTRRGRGVVEVVMREAGCEMGVSARDEWMRVARMARRGDVEEARGR